MSGEGWHFEYKDDGDPHVYIKTTWGTLMIVTVGLIALGAWLF